MEILKKYIGLDKFKVIAVLSIVIFVELILVTQQGTVAGESYNILNYFLPTTEKIVTLSNGEVRSTVRADLRGLSSFVIALNEDGSEYIEYSYDDNYIYKMRDVVNGRTCSDSGNASGYARVQGAYSEGCRALVTYLEGAGYYKTRMSIGEQLQREYTLVAMDRDTTLCCESAHNGVRTSVVTLTQHHDSWSGGADGVTFNDVLEFTVTGDGADEKLYLARGIGPVGWSNARSEVVAEGTNVAAATSANVYAVSVDDGFIVFQDAFPSGFDLSAVDPLPAAPTPTPCPAEGCHGAPDDTTVDLPVIEEGYIHPGIDIRPDSSVAGSDYVYATHSGFVTYAGPAPASVAEKGWVVQIESDLNRDNVADVITRYTHMLQDSLMINDVRYRRRRWTPNCFIDLESCFAELGITATGLEKLPYGYGPYVTRNQMIGVIGDSGSPGEVHVQYEIVTNRYMNTYGADLASFDCRDTPYTEVCATDEARPGFFFPLERRVDSPVRSPVYANPGNIVPPVLPTPTPTPIPTATPAPDTPPADGTPVPTNPPVSGEADGQGIRGREVRIINGELFIADADVDEDGDGTADQHCGGHWQVLSSNPPSCAAGCGGAHGISGGSLRGPLCPELGCTGLTSVTVQFDSTGGCAQETISVSL